MMRNSLGNSQITLITRVVTGTYILFMLGFFFIPNAVDQYKFYSIGVFLPALLLLPGMVKLSGHDRLFLLMIAYLLWMLLSSFWSGDFSPADFLKTLRLAAYISIFILFTSYLAIKMPLASERIVSFIGIAAALAAVISIPLWYSTHPFPNSRIIGMGTLDNPNPSAFVYGFVSVSCCHLALHYHKLWLKLCFSLCAVALVTLVLLTQSNTGILATTSSIAVLLLMRHSGKLLYMAAGVIVTLAAIIFLSYSLGLLKQPMDSGFKQRIEIWKKIAEQIEQAPLIGHGYQKQMLAGVHDEPLIANYAHSAILASFRDGGLVGATLHLLILITALAAAHRYYAHNKDPVYFAYLLFGFICMLADTDQLITRPRELWIIFWWPLGLLIASRIRKQAG